MTVDDVLEAMTQVVSANQIIIALSYEAQIAYPDQIVQIMEIAVVEGRGKHRRGDAHSQKVLTTGHIVAATHQGISSDVQLA